MRLRARLRAGEVEEEETPLKRLLKGCREQISDAVRWNVLQHVAEADHARPARARELEPASGGKSRGVRFLVWACVWPSCASREAANCDAAGRTANRAQCT